MNALQHGCIGKEIKVKLTFQSAAADTLLHMTEVYVLHFVLIYFPFCYNNEYISHLFY